MSAADMNARILGEHNRMTRAEAAGEVDRGELRKYLADNLSGAVTLVVPKGAAENAENIRAVVLADRLGLFVLPDNKNLAHARGKAPAGSPAL